MAHRAAALKSLRSDEKRRLRNKTVKSRLRTEETKFGRMVQRGDVAGAEGQLNLLTKLFQRAAARKIVKDNRAARKQAQFQRRVNELKAAAK